MEGGPEWLFRARLAGMDHDDHSAAIPSASHRVTNEVLFGLVTARIGPEARVLDFGAGRGHMAQRLGRWFESKGKVPAEHVFACEVAPEVFQYKAIPCVRMGFDSVIPFEPGTFDLILAIEVLEHTPRPYDFLFEAFAKLRPGGWLVFSTPNPLHMKSRFQFLLTGFAEMYGPPSSDMANAGRICGHIMPLSYPWFVYGLKRAGFVQIETASDRHKKSSRALALLMYPFLRLASARFNSGLRKYDEKVWEENREIANQVNQLGLLSSRSCIMLARKP